jgi:type 1 fimbria pilin
VVSATDGIIKIATTGANNTPHAVGVGIQLSTTESVVGKVNLNNPLEYTLPTDGRLSITLPLYARYIKTASTVTGGKANGKLTFTVTYK